VTGLRLRLFCLAAATALLATPVLATTWTVNQDGTGDFTAIQDAIDAAAAGDVVEVSPGIYVETLDYLDKEIQVAGVAGRGATMLDAGCTAPALDLSGVGVGGSFEEFTVQGICPGPSTSWGVVAFDSSASIQGVHFVSTDWLAGGIWTTGWPCPADPFHIADVAFSGTHPFTAPGQQVGAHCDTVLSTALVVGDTSSRVLGLNYRENLTATNILVNSTSVDGAVQYYIPYDYAYPHADVREFRNITIALGSPTAGSGSIFALQSWGDPVVASSVLAAENGAIYVVAAGAPGASVAASDTLHFAGTGLYAEVATDPLLDPTGANGNILADPMFIAWSDDGDWTNDNLCLAPGSPGVDAGDPDPAYNDPDGTRNDMGAFGGPGAPDCTYMLDADGDGYAPIMGDCDDGNMGVFPWAPETDCDGQDSDCDGLDGGEPCTGDDDDSADDDDDAGDDDSSPLDDDDSSSGDDDDIGDDDSAGDDDAGDDDSAVTDDDDAELDDDDSGGSAGVDCASSCTTAPASSRDVVALVSGVLALIGLRRRRWRGA